MNHGSLFSGIGGFDLAAEWMGWNNVFHCEWNEFGQKILKYYWPNATSYGDIVQTDFTIHRGAIDVLTGGFPCQPYSTAGKRLGKEDDRHLWPEMLRAIQEIQPRYVVGENVRGLTNWNGGMVFDEVQADLETLGYEVQPFLLPACAVNAPHRRDRIWFIAYNPNARIKNLQFGGENGIYEAEFTTDPTSDRRERKGQGIEIEKGLQSRSESTGQLEGRFKGLCGNEHTANTGCSDGENWLHGKEQSRETTKFGDCYTKFGRFSKFPTTEPTICSGNDGISSKLVGITFSKHRNESIKGYGNAIVPQVALQIFKAIEQMN